MSIKGALFIKRSIFTTNEKKEIAVKLRGDKEISTRLDEYFRDDPRKCEEVGEISIIDCDLPSFLVSINIRFDKLTELNLEGNLLSKWATTSTFPSLMILDLSHNRFTAIPDVIKHSGRQLRHLKMRHNLITKVHSADVRSLTKLELLDLSQNKLEDISRIVRYCRSLTELYLISNKIRELPPDFYKKLMKLEQLHLSGNPIAELHADLKNLKNLKALGISFTNIQQLPRSIIELKQLSRVLVENTPLIVPKLACAKRGVKAIQAYFSETQDVLSPEPSPLQTEEDKERMEAGSLVVADRSVRRSAVLMLKEKRQSSALKSPQGLKEEKSAFLAPDQNTPMSLPQMGKRHSSIIIQQVEAAKVQHDFQILSKAYESIFVQQTDPLSKDKLTSFIPSLKAHLVDDKKRYLLAFIHINDSKLYKYLMQMLEKNDVYKVKMQLHYVLDYLDSYISSYQTYLSYKEGKLSPEKVGILGIYNASNPNFFIRMDDTQFRTKVTTSMELLRILRHCGFELHTKSREYLFLPKTETAYNNLFTIRQHIQRIANTRTDILD